MTTKKERRPRAPKGYRQLKPGEQPREGDIFFDYASRRWLDYESYAEFTFLSTIAARKKEQPIPLLTPKDKLLKIPIVQENDELFVRAEHLHIEALHVLDRGKVGGICSRMYKPDRVPKTPRGSEPCMVHLRTFCEELSKIRWTPGLTLLYDSLYDSVRNTVGETETPADGSSRLSNAGTIKVSFSEMDFRLVNGRLYVEHQDVLRIMMLFDSDVVGRYGKNNEKKRLHDILHKAESLESGKLVSVESLITLLKKVQRGPCSGYLLRLFKEAQRRLDEPYRKPATDPAGESETFTDCGNTEKVKLSFKGLNFRFVQGKLCIERSDVTRLVMQYGENTENRRRAAILRKAEFLGLGNDLVRVESLIPLLEDSLCGPHAPLLLSVLKEARLMFGSLGKKKPATDPADNDGFVNISKRCKELKQIEELVNADQFKYWDQWGSLSTAKKVKAIINILNRVSEDSARRERIICDIHNRTHAEATEGKA